MANRICAKCGKDRELKGGKVCEKGHFICKYCVYDGSGILFTHERKYCPLCDKKLT